MTHHIANPPAPALALRLVLAFLITGCLVLSAFAFASALTGNTLPLVFAAGLWLPLAWGLSRRHPVARQVALALLWLVIIVMPIGVINPFAAMDGLVSVDMPLWRLLVPVFSGVAVALFMVHILGKYKAAFGRNEQRD